MAKPLVVNGYSSGWLHKGFPWVYDKEVVKGGGEPGQLREVRDGQGKLLGTALVDRGWIAARVYRHDGGPLDKEWVYSVLDRAASLRHLVIDPETDGFRLVNAENDGLPGVRIDWWSHHAVVILDSPACAPLLDLICDWLEERRQPRGIHLCYRTDGRDNRDFSKVKPAPGLLRGHEPSGSVRVRERGLCIDVLPQDGPDVGLYADMRQVRAFLEPFWGGTSVLNTFAYTGAFSVAAALN
ncbi:MAG: hypothetical protein GWP91_04855, partial [Rhodobacterales bacterium]|nr:hypothetical protein [Rhodobacterales bacterium]